MSKLGKSLFTGLLLALFCSSISAQQVTRERLLRLFYQANSAQKKGNTEKAIEYYKEILTKAPGLPDPYLHLGNIFYEMKDDAFSQRKAQISYNQYLKLKPDADDSALIQQRIYEIEADFKAKERLIVKDTTSMQPKVPEAEVQEEVVEVPVEIVKPTITVTIPETELVMNEEEAIRETVSEIVPDSVLVVSNEQHVKADKKLLGRWVSRRLDREGRERWILDLYSQDGDLWMRLNDNSTVLKDIERENHNPLMGEATMDGNEMSFRFNISQSAANAQDTKKTGMSSVVAELFDVDFDNLKSSFFTSDSEESNSEKVQTTEQFEFLLHTLGERLSGKVIQKTLVDGKAKGSGIEDAILLFKVPADYEGFDYIPISDDSKASNLELRRLLNRKSTESSSNVSSLNDLACMMASGVGTKKNMRMAVAHFMEAAGKNNLFAMLNLAKLYQEGNGVEKDMAKAQELYQRAFDAGYTDAMVLCGDAIIAQIGDDIDYKEAVKCYEKAVLKRSPYASFRLGWAYMEGIGVDVDEKRALSYYQRAVDMQYPDAMAEMAVMYREGLYVREDVNKAMDLLLKAAAKNSSRAMKELSDMYLDGNTVEPDFYKSKEWLKKYMLEEENLIEGYCTVKNEVKNILRPVKK